MMPELKPCPCGKPAGYVGGSSRLDGLLTASIECSTFCGFRVEKNEIYKRKDHTPAEMTGFTLLLRHKAIKAWNTRPDGGDSLREAKLPDFHEVMSAVEQGWQCWAMKPHNKKWLRIVESTPIPNDVRVNISSAIVGWLKTWQENQASLAANNKGTP